jgi:hypothetical protein
MIIVDENYRKEGIIEAAEYSRAGTVFDTGEKIGLDKSGFACIEIYSESIGREPKTSKDGFLTKGWVDFDESKKEAD